MGISADAIDFPSPKVQEATAAPKLTIKAHTKGAYCTTLRPTLYPLLGKYHQDDEGNILYMALNNQHEFQQLSKKLIKFAPSNTA
ncbi:MAG: hypothetical protein AAF900_02575 [Bacteroidota bacterium]